MNIRTTYILLLIGCFTLTDSLFAGPSSDKEGHSIKFRLKDFRNDTVILGQRFNDSYIRKDTAILDASGRGEFRGDEPLEQGMYLVYLPNNRYFDLIIGEEQQFSFENDTSDLLMNMKVTGSVDNIAFYDYQKYLQVKREEAMALQEQTRNAASEKDSLRLSGELNDLNEKVQASIKERIDAYDGTFFSVFLQALQEVEVPDPPRDENGNIIDSLFQYKYYKAHYFDNFDPSDVRLLRTPLYERKIMRYIERVVVQVPDSLIVAVDMLVEKSRSDPQLFRFMLITLFNHFAQSQIMGMDAVYVHIAEKYYIPEAEWSDEEFISKLKNRVEKLRPTLIGKVAPDFQLVHVSSDHMIQAAEDEELKKNPYVGSFFNLHDIKARYTILYFWECDCGHCQKQTPILYEVYQRLKDKGVQVVAVHTLGGEEGKVKWINHVNEHGYYEWINCWNPYDFEYKNIYDISSTPQLFILDEDKKIVAKRIAPEQAEQIINALLDKDDAG
jgi:thiol-disulfide isomerase/thioredoxin